MADDLAYLPALELRERYARRELSPVEVTRAVLDRIEAVGGRVNAFVTVTPELALEQAQAAERAYAEGEAGPLAGVPVSIKDLTPTKGIRTTRGSLVYADDVPDADAPIVERLLAAGAVMLGKTNTPEAGWKGETTNRVVGSTHNPWKHGRTCGGSSGGAAAAVAMGMGPLAEGSDGAGSIRIPAGFCGVYGLKPSFGRVPRASSVSLLSHNGPIARTVRDAALMLDVAAGADARDRFSMPADGGYLEAAQEGAREGSLAGWRVAWSPDLGYAAAEPEVAQIAGAAARRFEELGCTVEEAHPAEGDPWQVVDVIWAAGQAAAYVDEDLQGKRELLDPGRLEVMEAGLRLTAAQLAVAHRRQAEYSQALAAFFEHYDLLLTPTLPLTAFPVGEDYPATVAGRPRTYLSWTAFTYPFNLTGQPAATAPCGFASDGLPVGLQIVGRWRDDAAVLRASAAFEALAPWADRRPPDA